jgi:hypothetical protein
LVYSIAVCIEALVESGASGEGSDAAILKAAAIRGSVLGSVSIERLGLPSFPGSIVCGSF